MVAALRIGVLALQGDFARHLEAVGCCGGEGAPVRSPEDLESVGALIIPGGESTTMLGLIDRFDLRDPLVKRIAGGMAVFGTCAGGIVLAGGVAGGERPLGLLDIEIERNAYGRQQESFEADIAVAELDIMVRAVFIRAPVIVDSGDARVMAEWADRPVLLRAQNILVCTFHPELVADYRIHRYFIDRVCGAGPA